MISNLKLHNMSNQLHGWLLLTWELIIDAIWSLSNKETREEGLVFLKSYTDSVWNEILPVSRGFLNAIYDKKFETKGELKRWLIEHKIVNILREKDEIRPSALAKMLGITESVSCKYLSRLTKKGVLIVRRNDYGKASYYSLNKTKSSSYC